LRIPDKFADGFQVVETTFWETIAIVKVSSRSCHKFKNSCVTYNMLYDR